MKLKDLFMYQKQGAFKVEKDVEENGIVVVGGLRLSRSQCDIIANKIGWIEGAQTSDELINKTNKFIKGIRKSLTQPKIIENTDVVFQNFRYSNSLVYYDRIKMVMPRFFDITVIYNVYGYRGKYVVYSDENQFMQPVTVVRTAKELGQYINSLVVA